MFHYTLPKMIQANDKTDVDGYAGLRPILIILILGLLVRLALLYATSDVGLAIADERDYHLIALNIIHGHGFANGAGNLTSSRPPLYPYFVSLVWTITGTTSLVAVRMAQVLLSLANVWLLYQLGLRLFTRRIALLAAAAFCFYPSWVAFNFLFLTEVLFVFLLTLVALGYVMLAQTGRVPIAWGTGCALGLAALTRSVLWLFPVVLCPLVFISVPGMPRMRLQIVLCLFFGYALVMTPWAVRNTRLQRVFTAVDTLGGIALWYGNGEDTLPNRTWDWSGRNLGAELHREYRDVSDWTEGQKEKWAMKQALTYMLSHPLKTLHLAVIKFADFWGLERVIISYWQLRYARPPSWVVMTGTLAITISYIAIMLLASLRLFSTPPGAHQFHMFIFLLTAFIVGMHMITFGHSRYHLPLIPFLSIYAAAAVSERSWLRLRERRLMARAPIFIWVGLLVIWGRELLIVDAERIKHLLKVFFL